MRQGRRAEELGSARDWTGASIRMTCTHLHRPYDDTVSAYVIADEGSTTIYIAMHRVLACHVTKKKPRTSRTPHIRQDNRDDTDTQQFIKDITQLRLHASRVAAAVWFAWYRALM
jgi:hypothetical protein